MDSTQALIKERIAAFCEHPFFKQYPSLVVAILDCEIKTGVKLPNSFELIQMPIYQFGERSIMLARLHHFFIFGFDFDDGYWEFSAFPSKPEMKLFFTQMEGLDREHLAYWLRQIDDIPKK